MGRRWPLLVAVATALLLLLTAAAAAAAASDFIPGSGCGVTTEIIRLDSLPSEAPAEMAKLACVLVSGRAAKAWRKYRATKPGAESADKPRSIISCRARQCGCVD